MGEPPFGLRLTIAKLRLRCNSPHCFRPGFACKFILVIFCELQFRFFDPIISPLQEWALTVPKCLTWVCLIPEPSPFVKLLSFLILFVLIRSVLERLFELEVVWTDKGRFGL